MAQERRTGSAPPAQGARHGTPPFALPPPAAADPPRMIGIGELAAMLKVSVATAKRYVAAGDLPPPIRLGSRKCKKGGPDKKGNPRLTQVHRWFVSDIEAFLRNEPRGWADKEGKD